MNREAVEKFIDMQDKDHDIDTSERLELATRTGTPPGNIASPSSAGRSLLSNLQVTPTKNSSDSHPLNVDEADQDESTQEELSQLDVDLFPEKKLRDSAVGRNTVQDGNVTNEDPHGSIRRKNTFKRKSLIVPVLSPENKLRNQPGVSSLRKHQSLYESAVNTPLGRKSVSRLADEGSVSQTSRVGSFGALAASSPSVQPRSPILRTDAAVSNDEVRNDTKSDKGDTDGLINIEMLLQSLANKELEVLERTKKVHDLLRQAKLEDQMIKQAAMEIHQLKRRVRDLVGNQASVSSHDSTPSDQNSTNNDTKKQAPSLWNKSVSLLNQFDQLIQGTVDTKLGLNDTDSYSERTMSPKPEHEGKEEHTEVGSSLWSLMNDLKQGLKLLSSDDVDVKQESDASALYDNEGKTSSKRITERKGGTFKIKGVETDLLDETHSLQVDVADVEMQHYNEQ